MTQFNNNGFVIKRADGRLLADSHVSAFSHRVAVTHSVLEPVPGAPGLFVRLGRREVAALSGDDRAQMYDAARAWYYSVNGAEWAARDDAALARQEQIAALAQGPSGVAFATPETAADESASAADEVPETDVGESLEVKDDTPPGVASATPELGDDELPGQLVAAADPADIDAITLEDLQARARDLDIPGRSKMSKAALFEAVRAAEAD
ncbi:MAG: hypothetical protein Kow00120_00350 [Anaerolineae bacterium]